MELKRKRKKTLGPIVLKGTLCHTTSSAAAIEHRNRSRRTQRSCFQVVFSVGSGSVRWSRNDRHRSGRKRTQLRHF